MKPFHIYLSFHDSFFFIFILFLLHYDFFNPLFTIDVLIKLHVKKSGLTKQLIWIIVHDMEP